MPSDLDIYRSAGVIIEHHGDNVKSEAERRAEAMRDKGDPDGQRVWLAIMRKIEELQHGNPSGRNH